MEDNLSFLGRDIVILFILFIGYPSVLEQLHELCSTQVDEVVRLAETTVALENFMQVFQILFKNVVALVQDKIRAFKVVLLVVLGHTDRVFTECRSFLAVFERFGDSVLVADGGKVFLIPIASPGLRRFSPVTFAFRYGIARPAARAPALEFMIWVAFRQLDEHEVRF